MRGVAYALEQRAFLMGLRVQGRSLSCLSRLFGVPRRILSRWWARYQQGGLGGLRPRSRRPMRSPARLCAQAEQEILRLRRRGWGPARIALALGVGHSTVHRLLVRRGKNHLHVPVRRSVVRYEKSRPGELLHLDVKYLALLDNSSPEYEFAAVDDFSREAVVAITTQRTSRAATTFLEQVLARLPYRVEVVMTDNHMAFTMRYALHSERHTRFEQACQSLGIEHRLLRPRAPESNGKVERFIKMVDEECFAVRRPRRSKTRMRVLQEFLWYYNHQRPHLSLGGLTPVQRREAFFAQAQV